jgi:hypothetical protein
MNFTTIADAKRKTGLSYLGNTNVSGKIEKSQKKDNTLTYCIYLAPADTSGYNVCPASTPECRKGCLATSGRARMEYVRGETMIEKCRINKTKLFFKHQEFFMNWLVAEINSFKLKSIIKKMNFAVRLNGTSDIDWSKVKLNNINIFDLFSDVNFYDYTKNKNKFKNKPTNYHLTLSYTGRNWNACKEMLDNGNNVAMVFNIPAHKPLPKEYRGYKVIDGDITDLRIKDSKGIIVGLHWKNIANKETNEEIKNGIFAIQPNDENIKY